MTERTFPLGTILGYPRIGPRRELKRAVEAFWRHDIAADELERTTAELRRATRERLVARGLGATDSSIPESFSYYDQVLDAAVAVGAIPERFADLVDDDGSLDLAGYFTIARGEGERAPLEMTKWFDSNYHYLVPEIGPDTDFRLASDRLVREVAEARADGYVTRPVLVGPVTLLLLSKPADGAPAGFAPLSRLEQLLPVYAELLSRLAGAGAEWVQLDEPALVSESLETPRGEVLAAAQRAYDALGAGRPLGILVAAPYGSLDDALPVLEAAPIDAIALDLVKGAVPTAGGDKLLVGGVIDGHNIWRGDLEAAFGKLEQLRAIAPAVAV
jgi:5-methyltetrahydropteroyltriglutamate--homocysteine methyltransferase